MYVTFQLFCTSAPDRCKWSASCSACYINGRNCWSYGKLLWEAIL